MLRYGHGSVTSRPIRKSWQTTTNQPWGEINWRAPILDTKYLKILSQQKLLIGTTLELWRTYLSSDTERKGLTDWEERSPDQLLFLFYQYSYVINQQGLWATLYYDCIPTAKYSIISVYYICPQLKIEKRLRSKTFLQSFLDFNFCFQIFT